MTRITPLNNPENTSSKSSRSQINPQFGASRSYSPAKANPLSPATEIDSHSGSNAQPAYLQGSATPEYPPIHIRLTQEVLDKLLSTSEDEVTLDIQTREVSLMLNGAKLTGELGKSTLSIYPPESSPKLCRTFVEFSKIDATPSIKHVNPLIETQASKPKLPHVVQESLPKNSTNAAPMRPMVSKPKLNAAQHSFNPIPKPETATVVSKPTWTTPPPPKAAKPIVPPIASKPAPSIACNPKESSESIKPHTFASAEKQQSSKISSTPTLTSLKITKKTQNLPTKSKEMKRKLVPNARQQAPQPMQHQKPQQQQRPHPVNSSAKNPQPLSTSNTPSTQHIPTSKKPNGILSLNNKKRSILKSLPPSKRPKFRPFELDLQTN